VVHFAPPVGVKAETATKTECAACFAGAWDVLGDLGRTIPSGNVVLAVTDAKGKVLDGVPLTDGTAAGAAFAADVAGLVEAGAWSAASQPVARPTARDETVARVEALAPHDAGEWTRGAETFGISNAR